MIGDDHLDAGRPRTGDSLDGGDAAIDGHDHARPMFGEDPLDRFGPQAVAVLQAVRKKGDGVGAGEYQGGAQLGNRGHAVHVVVPEDDDAPPGPSGSQQNVGGLRDALHEEWIVQPGRVRVQELGCVSRGCNTSAEQEARHDLGHSGPAGQRADQLGVAAGQPATLRRSSRMTKEPWLQAPAAISKRPIARHFL